MRAPSLVLLHLGVSASALSHLRSVAHHGIESPDLWAATAVEDHVPGLTQELELTRTSGVGWYTASLKLGGNTSQVIVDTASPWLWSFGGSGENDDTQPERFSISYLSAQLGGTVVKESVALHGERATHGQCKAGKATDGDQFWLEQSKVGVQGVFGLACGTADSGAGAAAAAGLQTSLSCVSAALDAENGGGTTSGSSVFALKLGARGGTLSFGAPPFDLLPGLVAMPPSMQCGNWRAPMRVSLTSGAKGKDFGFAEATLDSAAPGIIGLSERVASLAEALGARIDVREGRMVFLMPCSRAGSLPTVELHLGQDREAIVRLSGDDLLVSDDAGAVADGGAVSASRKQCRLIFSGWDSPQWLLGMPFFRAVRGVVFNPLTQAVSIAP